MLQCVHRRLSLLTGLLLPVFAGPASALIAAGPTDEIRKIDLGAVTLRKDVVYGNDSDAHVFNAFVVKSERPTPVLVYINSGGWRSKPRRILEGKETEFAARLQPYFDAGLSLVQVSHRSLDRDDVYWPAPMEDVARAIQYLRSMSEEWSIDPARISLMGRSSGSHVAEMVAYSQERADPASDEPQRLHREIRFLQRHGGLDPWIE